MDDASPGRGGDTPAVDEVAATLAAQLLERDDRARAVSFGSEGG